VRFACYAWECFPTSFFPNLSSSQSPFSSNLFATLISLASQLSIPIFTPFLSLIPLFPSQVLLELKEYATEVDVDFVRKVHIRPVILPVLVTPPVTVPVPLTNTLPVSTVASAGVTQISAPAAALHALVISNQSARM
jgi:hypothetical protein